MNHFRHTVRRARGVTLHRDERHASTAAAIPRGGRSLTLLSRAQVALRASKLLFDTGAIIWRQYPERMFLVLDTETDGRESRWVRGMSPEVSLNSRLSVG
jgi:hypothetical protein